MPGLQVLRRFNFHDLNNSTTSSSFLFIPLEASASPSTRKQLQEEPIPLQSSSSIPLQSSRVEQGVKVESAVAPCSRYITITFRMNAPLSLYETILADKALTADEITKEFKKLKNYPATQNKRCFAGNPLLYHFMLDVLCQVETSGGMSIKNQAENEDRRQYWYDQMTKVGRTGTFAVRFFEVVRVCRCPINFFKPTIAKYLYKQLNAQKVLDPCAGWGGRLLGAMALGIDYIGFDTNQMLRPCYGKMMDALVPESEWVIKGSDDEAASDE